MKIARTLLLGALASLAAAGAKAQFIPPAVFPNPPLTASVPSGQLSASSGALYGHEMTTADLDTLRNTDGSLSTFRDANQFIRAKLVTSGAILAVRNTGSVPPPPDPNPTGYKWSYDGRAISVTEETVKFDTWEAGDTTQGGGHDANAKDMTVTVVVRP